MDRNYVRQLWLNAAMLVFFGALLLIGTFNDEAIAKALFSPDNIPVKVLTSTGMYPFFGSITLFLGVLFERTLHSGHKKTVKVILCVVCMIAFLFMGFIGGGSIADRNCLGSIFPEFNRNVPVILIFSVLLMYPLFFVGFHFAKKSDDKLLVQRIFVLLIMLLAAFLLMQSLKNLFTRPRFRTAVLGYEGIGFVPWYTRFAGAAEFSELYDINADEFLSFPSGHSIMSISASFIMPSLAWIFPKLRDRQLILSIAGFAFGMMIMFTRMILGAHYLSDVSMGAIIGTLLSCVYAVAQMIISAKHKKQ